MPVDRAFDERTKNICFPDDDKVSVVLKRAYFQAGYEAGQKTISPEVRDVLDKVKTLLGMFSYVKREGTPWANISAEVRLVGFMQIFEEVEKLLAKE